MTNVTLITGATGGIGRELAELFARDGHDLLLTGRDAARLDALAARLRERHGVRVETVTLDLAEEGTAGRLHAAAKERGLVVDHLVNNAGFGDWTGLLDADWSRQHAMMRVNMEAVAELSYRFGRDMREAGRGRILNIASVASMMAGPWMAMYFASKAFVRSLSEALAHELRGTGVTVTCVCPGPTSTGFEKASRMAGRNFFTMTRPADARALARFAYRAMLRGRTLAYHGPLTLLGAVGEHLLPRVAARSIAAFMNGGRPNAAHRRQR